MSFGTVRSHVQGVVRRRSGVAMAACSGLCVFGVVLALLSIGGSSLRASPSPPQEPVAAVEVGASPTVLVADESAAAGVLAGHRAVGVRVKEDSVALSAIHVGGVLDVLVTLADGPEGPGLVGQVVAGARVVAVAPGSDYVDVLLDAPPDAAMLLAHLVRRGLPLTYMLRQAPDEPRAFPALTLDQTRDRLGLTPRVSAAVAPTPAAMAPVPAPPAAAVAPTQAATATVLASPEAAGASEVHFVVYAGADLELIEHRFDVTRAALLAANPRLVASEPLALGTELVVPDLYGFFYLVQAQDTLETLSQRFQIPTERLRRVNDLPPFEVGVPVGVGLLIPSERPAWASAPAAR